MWLIWYWILSALAFFAALTSAGCGVEGVHSANPTTIIRVDPISKQVYLSNNKDVDVSVDEMTVAADKTFTVKKLVLVDKASSVREANRTQLEGLAIQSEAIGNAWAKGITAGSQLVTSLVPILGGLQARPMWGSGNPGLIPPGWTSTQPSVDVEALKKQLDSQGVTDDGKCIWETLLGLKPGTLCPVK